MLARYQNFFRSFLKSPRSVGALAPATRSLSRAVARVARDAHGRHSSLPLIELGAGTGALTNHLAPLGPLLVEQHEEWANLLRAQFPALEVRHECATRTLRTISQPVGLVTSIPLLNNPQSAELKDLLAAQYKAGLIRYCVLYTYGFSSPLRGRGFHRSELVGFVPRSFPPAYVWLYE